MTNTKKPAPVTEIYADLFAQAEKMKAQKPAPETRLHTCGYAYRPQNATYCWFCHCG